MNAMERTLCSLGHQEPDRVPVFLLVTMHGARELGLSIEEYFARGQHVAEGQLRMREKFGHDCLYSFFYAAIEVEAWGGEVVYIPDGPPNSGRPFIRQPEQINDLEAPDVANAPGLQRVFEATRLLKSEVGDTVPIVGVVMSPFSLPVMQMGFEAYFDLMLGQPELFARLMAINEQFCVDWANQQLAAGATAICYFDPLSSTTMITRDQYLALGNPVARRMIEQIEGPVANHFASGRCLPILDEVIATGAGVVGVSVDEDLAELKRRTAGKITLLGNLNGVEMRRWTPGMAAEQVRAVIQTAGPGGGLLLSDNHGEIPYQVPDEVLRAIVQAAHDYGVYPLETSAAE